jgi:predicted nuclease of predicted toxin-antitoxin system
MSDALAAGLRLRAIECVRVAELDRRGASDPDHLSWARDGGWVIVTHDGPFVGLAHSTPGHAGLVYCHQNRYSLGELIERLVNLAADETLATLRGKVVYL